MKKTSVSVALAAGLLAGGLSVSSASAADLGGDCCADLEERVAELEATTVRKGNRKVSLTVSGWVAEQVTWWDDGQESNVYVTGIGTTLSSHFKLTGAAQIAPGWSAGYVVHIETQSADPLFVNQNNDDARLTNDVSLLQSYWFLKSDTLGKVSVGQQSQASDNTAILVDGSGSLVPANWVVFDGTSFFLRSNTPGNPVAGLIWQDVLNCSTISGGIGADCLGVTTNSVRYDSPTFGGFSVSASWGEDDFWDVAARYAGEFNGVKLAIAAAYSHSSDEGLLLNRTLGNAGVLRRDSEYFQIGAYVQHVPTGLFLYGAYGHEDNDNVNVAGIITPENDHWYVKGGLRQRWTPLGHTVLYGEYGNHDDMMSNALQAAYAAGGEAVLGTNVTRWGLGIVQEIDAAAMSLWLSYRNMEGEVDWTNGVVRGTDDLETLHIVKFGALINF